MVYTVYLGKLFLGFIFSWMRPRNVLISALVFVVALLPAMLPRKTEIRKTLTVSMLAATSPLILQMYYYCPCCLFSFFPALVKNHHRQTFLQIGWFIFYILAFPSPFSRMQTEAGRWKPSLCISLPKPPTSLSSLALISWSHKGNNARSVPLLHSSSSLLRPGPCYTDPSPGLLSGTHEKSYGSLFLATTPLSSSPLSYLVAPKHVNNIYSFYMESHFYCRINTEYFCFQNPADSFH